jgi:hypothetical protein
MRRVGAGTVAALLWLGLVVPVAPAQSTSIKPEMVEEEGSWWSNLFSSKPKPEVRKPEHSSSTSGPDRSLEQERLRNAYLRRQAVCDRLLDIAEQTNNVALKEEAERLDEMAWNLYQEQSSRLGSGTTSARSDRQPPDKASPASSAASHGSSSRRFRGGQGALDSQDESAREGER